MKTFREIAQEATQAAAESRRTWTNVIRTGWAVVGVTLGSTLAASMLQMWVCASASAVCAGSTLFFLRDSYRARRAFWNDYMQIRQECLDDAQRFEGSL